MVYTGKSHSNEWFGGTTILGNLHIIHVYIYISYTYHTAGCRQHVLLSDLLQCRSSTYQHRVSDPECWRVVSRWRGFIFSEIQQPTNTSKLHRRSAANTCLTYLCCHKAGLFPNHPWNGQKHSILCPGHHWCFHIIFRFFFFLNLLCSVGLIHFSWPISMRGFQADPPSILNCKSLSQIFSPKITTWNILALLQPHFLGATLGAILIVLYTEYMYIYI